jgi:hypothetical protein
VESFARVRSLSLSGKLLRPFVDRSVGSHPFHPPPITNHPIDLLCNGRTYYKKVVETSILAASSNWTTWFLYSCSSCNVWYSSNGLPSDTIRTNQWAKLFKAIGRAVDEVTTGTTNPLQGASVSPPGGSRASSVIP